MDIGAQVIYIGPDPIFHGLKGTLVAVEDRSTHRTRLHFQPESNAIRAVPCETDDVRAIQSQDA
jgi:hypothetical protein